MPPWFFPSPVLLQSVGTPHFTKRLYRSFFPEFALLIMPVSFLVQDICYTFAWVSLDYIPRNRITGLYHYAFLIFLIKMTNCFCKTAVQINMPTGKVWSSLLIHQHLSLASVLLFHSRVSVQWHCLVILTFPDHQWNWTSFLKHGDNFFSSSLKCSFKSSAKFPIAFSSFFWLIFLSFFFFPFPHSPPLWQPLLSFLYLRSYFQF